MLTPNKPTILIFIDWFLPAFKAGGPIRSIANLITHLHNDFNFKIVTSNNDLGDNLPLENIVSNHWITKNNYQIIYLSENNRKQKIREILQTTSFDKVYLNSLFSKDFTLLPLLFLKQQKKVHKVVLAPRGMLGKGALNIKPVKKKIFLIFTKFMRLFNGILWHATTQNEAESIQYYFGKKSNIITVQNFGIKPSETPVFVAKTENMLRLVFLSRILPIKNLDYAIERLIMFDQPDIIFDIYGTIEDNDYWQVCLAKIAQLKNVKVNYKSVLNPVEVQSALSDYHYLFLPTKHENFGHAIAEALAAGCGVLISDQTPWKNLEEKKVGFSISLSKQERFVKALQICYEQSQQAYDVTRKNALSLYKSSQRIDGKIKLYKQLFA